MGISIYTATPLHFGGKCNQIERNTDSNNQKNAEYPVIGQSTIHGYI